MPERWARYIAGDPALLPLIPWDWREPPWEAILRTRQSALIDRPTLVEALRRQNEVFLGDDPTLRSNIEALLSLDTFVVTTGQQPGWLLGPLYTLVKAAHTIQLAEELNKRFQGQYRFVPLFWIAAEDHDADEVRGIALGWGSRLEYRGHFQGPVGRHLIEAAFPPEAEDLALQRYWKVGKRWDTAFRESMQALFQGTGLVWLSSDDPALKATAIPLWVREIQDKLTFHAHGLARQYLRAIGETASLHPRPINLFWLSDTERRYPEPKEESELLQAAYRFPQSLSPNVLLRPVFQEYILPNVAYVAGPGEVRYWLELLPIFQAFEVPMPVIYPRGHLRVLTAPPPSLPRGLSWRDIWGLSQNRLRTLLAELWGESTLRAIQEAWLAYRPPIEKLAEGSYMVRVERELQRLWRKGAERLRRAALKELQNRFQPHISEVLRYREAIEPEGQLQERTLNIHAFSKKQPEEWLRNLMREIRFVSGEFSVYHAWSAS
ncbi:MAG: bacillithiol biosynthesis cysteine-adding enzyme BshC [Bacteroidia bacterium]|nr:bacillithiol biosynthesis cysteine-adding enzyme BshC [Bacteroidia bacterium]